MQAPNNLTSPAELGGASVASRQVVLLLGAASSETIFRNQGRLCEHQLACALLLEGLEGRGGLDSQGRRRGSGGLDRSCTAARPEGYSGSGRILVVETFPGSELTTELRFRGASPDCLGVELSARAVSISPPLGSGETMGAHFPSEVYLGQDTRRPGPERSIETAVVVWRRSAGGPRLNFSRPSLQGALSQHTQVCTPSSFCHRVVFTVGNSSRDEPRTMMTGASGCCLHAEVLAV